jgi:hypothetical protein
MRKPEINMLLPGNKQNGHVSSTKKQGQFPPVEVHFIFCMRSKLVDKPEHPFPIALDDADPLK